MISDPLSTLGLHPGATIAEAKERFRAVALKYHPDKNKSPEASRRFVEAKDSLEALEEDHTLLNRCLSIKNRTRGKDLHVSLSVRAEDLYFREPISVIAPRNVPCSTCHGTGAEDGRLHPCGLCDGAGNIPGSIMRIANGSNECPQCSGSGVHVPEQGKCGTCKGRSVLKCHNPIALDLSPSTQDKHTVLLPDKGDCGAFLGTTGNLFVTVRVEQTPGMELYKGRPTVWVNTTPAQFVTGDTVVTVIRGETLSVRMPPLTGKAEARFRGVPVTVLSVVTMPAVVGPEMRELYRRILQLEKVRFPSAQQDLKQKPRKEGKENGTIRLTNGSAPPRRKSNSRSKCTPTG